MTSITIKRLNISSELQEIFDTFPSETQNSICHLYSWYQSYFNVNHQQDVFFLVVYSEQNPIAIFPIKLQKLTKWLPFIYYAELYYSNEMGQCDFIATKPLNNYWVEIKKYLKSNNVHLFRFQSISENSHAVQSGILQDSDCYTFSHFSKWLSCTDTHENFLSKFKSKFRANLKRKYNNASKLGKISFTSYNCTQDLEIAFERFLKVEDSGWKGADGTSILKQPKVKAYYLSMLNNLGPSNQCLINILSIDDKDIAATFCLTTNNIIHILKIGYDEDYNKISPGQLIVNEMIKSTELNQEFNTISFITDMSWMDIWKPNKTKVYVAYKSVTWLGNVLINGLKFYKKTKTKTN